MRAINSSMKNQYYHANHETRSFINCLSQEHLMQYKYSFVKYLQKLNRVYDANSMEFTLDTQQLHAFIKHIGLIPQDQVIQSIRQLRNHSANDHFDLSLILEILGRMSVEEQLQNQIRRLFIFFDKPKQSKISATKLNKGLMKIKQKLSSESIDEIMMKYDLDGDGYLNYDQFLLMMLSP